MPIFIAAIIVILLLSCIPYIILTRESPSQQIIKNIYDSKKTDSGSCLEFTLFLKKNINEKNRYKINNNIHE